MTATTQLSIFLVILLVAYGDAANSGGRGGRRRFVVDMTPTTTGKGIFHYRGSRSPSLSTTTTTDTSSSASECDDVHGRMTSGIDLYDVRGGGSSSSSSSSSYGGGYGNDGNDDDDYRNNGGGNDDYYYPNNDGSENDVGYRGHGGGGGRGGDRYYYDDDYYRGSDSRSGNADKVGGGGGYYDDEGRYREDRYDRDDVSQQRRGGKSKSRTPLPTALTSPNRKLGVIFLSSGAAFTVLGITLFFNKTLMRLGNILFVIGVPLLIGPGRTAGYFLQPRKARATGCLGCGIFLVLVGHPVIGILLEVFGLLNLFGNMFPLVRMMAKNLPVVGGLFGGGGGGYNGGGGGGTRKERPRYDDGYYEDEGYERESYR